MAFLNKTESLRRIISHRAYVLIEFFALCVTFPTVIIALRLAPYMLVLLWGAAIYCAVIFALAQKPDWRGVWGRGAVTWPALRPILLRWVVAVLGMIVFTAVVAPDRLFGLLYTQPQIIPVIWLVYPVLSALPQEFIFCTFFFWRYAGLFQKEWHMVLASALVFAYAHVLFINWVAPTLGFLAGLIFARTYARSRSLALVTLEHALYGNALFLVGLGWYFYHGAVATP